MLVVVFMLVLVGAGVGVGVRVGVVGLALGLVAGVFGVLCFFFRGFRRCCVLPIMSNRFVLIKRQTDSGSRCSHCLFSTPRGSLRFPPRTLARHWALDHEVLRLIICRFLRRCNSWLLPPLFVFLFYLCCYRRCCPWFPVPNQC